MKKLILITGGQRSGKSKEAEALALRLSPNPVYVATAHIWDEEFKERVRRHQARRGPQWTNIEEEMALSRHDLTGRVIVIDCVTLWLTSGSPISSLPTILMLTSRSNWLRLNSTNLQPLTPPISLSLMRLAVVV